MSDPGKKWLNPRKRSEDWLDEDEYPDDKDVEEFGEESPVDYDPLTMGRVGNLRVPFWTRKRVAVALVVFVLVIIFVFGEILPLLRR